jgi:hypothetical protein
MKKVNSISVEEKQKREELLAKFGKWKLQTNSNSLLAYSEQSGCSYEYLKTCQKWKSQKENSARHKNNFSENKLFKVNKRLINPDGLVKINVGKLVIEVTEQSSLETLNKIFSALGCSNVF